MKKVLLLAALALGFCLHADAQCGPGQVPIAGNRGCRNTGAVVVKGADGSVSIRTMVLKGDGSDALWYWSDSSSQPSALSTDAPNGFGWAGASVSGDTMPYDELIALWDNFTGAGAVPGWAVTKTDIGASQDGAYRLYAYKFVPSGVATGGSFDRTVFIVTGQHASEWGAVLATWRFFYNAVIGRVKLPPYLRFVVVPCANPWGWMQSPRTRYNSRDVDLNRNWPKFWDTETDTHKGSAALSESETAAIAAAIANTTTADVVIDAHTADGNMVCRESGNPPSYLTSPVYEPYYRLIGFLNAPYNASCWASAGQSSMLVNWAASNRMQAFTAEHGRLGLAAAGDSQWMTSYVRWLGNLVLSYSQAAMAQIPKQSVITSSFLTASVDLASVANGACSADQIQSPVYVARVGDVCSVESTSVRESGTFFTCRVTTPNGVRWQFCNLSGAPVDRAADTYTIRTWREYNWNHN